MIDYDTSQYPAGALGWQGLLEAVENASPGDESEWIEFKANLDLRQKTDRPVLAKAIVAFANREVARATQHFDGRGLIVIGLEPGNLVGAPDIDPAELHNAIQPYLADPAPRWDVQYLKYKGKAVHVVAVNAPQPGDPIHCIAKEGDKVRDGDVYVRNMGKSAPAKSVDLRRLSTRLLAQAGPGLDVEVLAAAGDGVPLFEDPAGWVDRWVDAERDRLMAPLAPPPAAPPADFRFGKTGLAALGLSDSLLNQVSAATRLADMAAMSNPFHIKHEEERTEEAYEAEVEEYLDKCRQRLPKAVKTLRVALTPAVVFQVRNQTDANFEKLEVHVHVEGDVTAFDGRAEFRGLGTYTPKPPRIWGPWTESRMPAINGPDYSHLIPSRTAVVPYVPPPGPTIVNGGSADITFQPLDLRPHANEDLDDGILLLAGPSLNSDITCTWSATATNMNGRAEGAFTIPLRKRRIDLSEYLHHGSTARTWSRDDPDSNIVFPDDWDDEPNA